ncbi:MAG: sulfatase-like hydrolase/transferase [Deltaproteobacteria bacterium]|nr:sulfatase-like hydrolase/transferase [Deltaproteobacteria bacterium]
MPASAPRPPPREEPRDGLQNLVLVVLDSCRWDTWQRAIDGGAAPHLARLGRGERRYSYASWTAPSHYNLLTGLLPHRSPAGVFASEVYKEEYLAYSKRLGTEVEFKQLLPGLWLPGFLQSLGYETSARVSLPVLNPRTGINRDFDSYRLMESHNDFGAILDEVRFGADRPGFWMLNVGETHYPYVAAGEDASELPHISGVHGVAKRLGQGEGPVSAAEAPDFFEGDSLQRLHDKQVATLRGLDRSFERLFDEVPKDTWVIVTADHGELFGEGGYFGHGPIAHNKVFEVPFVEGKVR